MSNSSFVTYTKLSPNCTKPRNHIIDTITIHCMAGNLSVESCGNLFANPSTKASSNYGIDSNGKIALYVEEANRSWATSSSSNDNRAITIEVANTVAADPWPVSDKAYSTLIDLVADICKRNNIKKLLWKADPSLIGQADKQNMTAHRWFANKSCPGDYLYSRFGDIANQVNKRLEGDKMTGEEIYNALMDYTKTLSVPEWAEEEFNEAIKEGITDGSNPMQLIPRYQAALMSYRTKNKEK